MIVNNLICKIKLLIIKTAFYLMVMWFHQHLNHSNNLLLTHLVCDIGSLCLTPPFRKQHQAFVVLSAARVSRGAAAKHLD